MVDDKMNKKEMIKQLKRGIHPIDVTIQKWIDILNEVSVNRLRTRHQYDEGQSNCALCYVYGDCKACLVFLKYKVKCDGSKNKNDKKYKKDFYAQYRETGNAQIVIDMLNNIKKNMFWILLRFNIKQIFTRFILWLTKIIKLIIYKFKRGIKEVNLGG